MDTAAERLRRARTAAGFATASEAAAHFGWNENTYKSHENGQRNLKPDVVERYASALGVAPAWIQFGALAESPALVRNAPPAPGGFAEEAGGVRGGIESRPADVDLSRPRLDGLVGDRDLPVYGSALGGPDGEMLVNFEPIEWVRRPAPLDSVNGGFGFYMIGESMSPAFEPGDMVLCHPTKPPFAGQDVLVIRQWGGGQHALVKRLVRMDGTGVRLRQYSPAHEFEVPRDELVSIHLVVGKYSRR
jgi:phage repressor protein C with HTH and peptisase S24 domain